MVPYHRVGGRTGLLLGPDPLRLSHEPLGLGAGLGRLDRGLPRNRGEGFRSLLLRDP